MLFQSMFNSKARSFSHLGQQQYNTNVLPFNHNLSIKASARMMHTLAAKQGLTYCSRQHGAPTATFYPTIQTQPVGNNLPGLLDHVTGYSEPDLLTWVS